MSSPNSNPTVQFQDLFDTALSEYCQKAGNNIATDPLTVRLSDCKSSDAVLEILEEQAHAFDKFRKGDWKVQLMTQLKPTIDILHRLSTSDVVVKGINQVRLQRSNYPLQKSDIYHSLCRNFHQRRQYLPVLVSYSQYLSFSLACVCSLDTKS
jgi:hypothetical protein